MSVSVSAVSISMAVVAISGLSISRSLAVVTVMSIGIRRSVPVSEKNKLTLLRQNSFKM